MKRKRLIVIIIFIVSTLALFSYWQNNGIVISKYDIQVDKNNSDDIKLKILQISDLHNKEFGNNSNKMIDLVKDTEPDIIAITGDFIDSYHVNTSVAIEVAEELVKIAPVYYVTGNHERAINDSIYASFEEELRKAGVQVLFNTVVSYNEEIDIIGLDDISLKSDDFTLESIMADVDLDKISVLLVHEPQELEWYAECGVDVVLSGHAHGGQIRIPFTNMGLVAPDQGFFPQYTSGVYEKEATKMVVSRGLGNSIIPIRVFNRPELVEINIY